MLNPCYLTSEAGPGLDSNLRLAHASPMDNSQDWFRVGRLVPEPIETPSQNHAEAPTGPPEGVDPKTSVTTAQGGVTLYARRGSRTLKAAEEAIPGNHWKRIKRVTLLHRAEIPARADMVIQAGSGAPSAKLEFWATQKRAWVTCLPEADQHLADRVRVALEDDLPLVILDAALFGWTF